MNIEDQRKRDEELSNAWRSGRRTLRDGEALHVPMQLITDAKSVESAKRERDDFRAMLDARLPKPAHNPKSTGFQPSSSPEAYTDAARASRQRLVEDYNKRISSAWRHPEDENDSGR